MHYPASAPPAGAQVTLSSTPTDAEVSYLSPRSRDGSAKSAVVGGWPFTLRSCTRQSNVVIKLWSHYARTRWRTTARASVPRRCCFLASKSAKRKARCSLPRVSVNQRLMAQHRPGRALPLRIIHAILPLPSTFSRALVSPLKLPPFCPSDSPLAAALLPKPFSTVSLKYFPPANPLLTVSRFSWVCLSTELSMYEWTATSSAPRSYKHPCVIY